MPEEPMRAAQEWTEQAEVFIVMGSSLQVQPAASFPVLAVRGESRAQAGGRRWWEIDMFGESY
jgi:NAD-dependent SIR2 family protein deacetylase